MSAYRTAIIITSVILLIQSATALHVSGTWRTTDFFHFLAKFGFQKTNLKDKVETQGYIYGNITSNQNASHYVTLAVLDRGFFLEYYGNSTVSQREKACMAMFHKINTVAYDAQCNDEGPQDLLRKVPCPVGQLCPDEDNPKNIVENHQFTFHIEDLSQPRFWYMSLVACYRDSSSNCTWKPLEEDVELNYDIWLVNGNPRSKNQNPLEYQFSFDNQDTVEIYLVFLACYAFLTPLQVYAVMRQRHPVPKLFTIGLLFALGGVFLNVLHCLKFAFDGVGVESASISGGVLDICSQTVLMLLLLLLAKGWAITHKELTWRPVLFSIWAVYGLVHVLLYVWDLVKFFNYVQQYNNLIYLFIKQTELDVIDDVDAYQIWPGWLMLILRIGIMVICISNFIEYTNSRTHFNRHGFCFA